METAIASRVCSFKVVPCCQQDRHRVCVALVARPVQRSVANRLLGEAAGAQLVLPTGAEVSYMLSAPMSRRYRRTSLKPL